MMEISNNTGKPMSPSLAKALNNFLGLADTISNGGSLYARPDQINGMFASNRSDNVGSLNGAPITPSISSDGTLTYTYNLNTDSAWNTLNTQIKYIIDIINRQKLHEFDEDSAMDIARDAEVFGYEWIYENYGKDDIKEDGDFIAERVLDKMAEFVEGRLRDIYDFDDWEEMYDAATEIIMMMIDMDYVLSVIDEIMEAPTTMTEKLRDIGMSQSDFV